MARGAMAPFGHNVAASVGGRTVVNVESGLTPKINNHSCTKYGRISW